MGQDRSKTNLIRRVLQPLQLIALLSSAVTAAAALNFIPARLFLPDPIAKKHGQEPRRETPQGDSYIKLGTQIVSLNVAVTDRSSRVVEGLKKENFKIYDDKVEQTISFFSDEDAPTSIGIVFDISGSMSGDKIMQAKDALARFIQTSHEQDEYFLIRFGSNPQLSLDGVRDGQALLNQFNNVYPKGNTALYDAVYLGIEKVSRGIYPKHAIILISDGEDNHSRYSFDNLRRRLQESDVTIYSIGIGMNRLPQKGNLGGGIPGAIPLEKLASVSGGKAFYPKNANEMTEIFERIALELRRRYSIGYLPSNFVADGKWRRVKVAVTIPRDSSRLIVRTREGYFAVKNPDDRQKQDSRVVSDKVP
jgi:Ca-activated chloride channel homolog